MEIGKLIEAYLTNLGVQFKLKTVASYAQRLERFRHFCEKKGVLLLSELTVHLLETYNASLDGISVNTRYVYLDSVKRFCEWLYEEDYIFFMIGQAICLPKWERFRFKGSETGKAKLLIARLTKKSEFPERDQAVLALAFIERLKVKEIEGLSTLDMNLMTQEMRLKTRQRFQKLQPQTGIYLRAYLKSRSALRPKTDHLIVGGRTGRKTVEKSIRLLVRHGIKAVKKSEGNQKEKTG